MTSSPPRNKLALLTKDDLILTRNDLIGRTQAAARDYAELLSLHPKDKAAHAKARARYKAAQSAEIQAMSQQNADGSITR